MTTQSSSGFSEMSAVIGELKGFVAQQVSINNNTLAEMKKVSEKMGNFTEVSATFSEYRKTLHERFNQFHTQLLDIDEELEQLKKATKEVELDINRWKTQGKILMAILYLFSTATSAVLVSLFTHYLQGGLHQ